MSCISVSDLLDYITPDADLKAREAQKKARAKLKGKPGQNGETVLDENQKGEDLSLSYPAAENTSDKENKSEAQFVEGKIDKVESNPSDQPIPNESNTLVEEDASGEGWQEAVPKGRSLSGRKSSSSSRRPTLAKLNTNFMNVSQSSRYRGKPTNFPSPRTNSNDASASAGPSLPASKKFVKSASFSPKQNSSVASVAGVEKLADSKSAPTTPAPGDLIATKSAPTGSAISVQAAGKLFSYKEVALAPPGTIVKAVAEQPSKGNPPVQQNPEVSNEIVLIKDAHNDVAVKKDVHQGYVQKPIEEKRLSVAEEETKSPVHEGQEDKEATIVTDNTQEVVESKVNKDAVKEVEAEAEAGSITSLGAKNSDSLKISNTVASKIALEIEVQESSQAASPDSHSLTVLSENSIELLDTNANESKKNGDEEQHESPTGNAVSKPTSPEGGKQDEAETGKETTKKLSAAAPPFNPSPIPVFGSVPVPGFKDHGGILPPPVNISPMLSVNPRRSPHQSATARVPYGPRISGGYNRYGNRVPRNKPVFQTGEHSTDGNPISPPTIMNPHATEFVPGQPWVPDGYPMPPNGYVASPNNFPMHPNGIPVTPNGYPVSLNGIPFDQNGLATSPTSASDSAPVANVESDLENNNKAAETSPTSSSDSAPVANVESDLENNNKAAETSPTSSSGSTHIANVESDLASKNEAPEEENKDFSSTEAGYEKQQIEQNSQEYQADNNEDSSHEKGEEKPMTSVPACSQEDKESGKDEVIEKNQSKCWGDYSDSEAEMVEVIS